MFYGLVLLRPGFISYSAQLYHFYAPVIFLFMARLTYTKPPPPPTMYPRISRHWPCRHRPGRHFTHASQFILAMMIYIY